MIDVVDEGNKRPQNPPITNFKLYHQPSSLPAVLRTMSRNASYTRLKSPVDDEDEEVYSPPLLPRQSRDSEDSLRALEISEGPLTSTSPRQR